MNMLLIKVEIVKKKGKNVVNLDFLKIYYYHDINEIKVLRKSEDIETY